MSVSDSPEKNEGMPTLDARAAALVARKISRSGQPWLHDEVARRMAERLPLIRQPTQHWVNWAPRIGGRVSHTLVQALYPRARQTVGQTYGRQLHHGSVTRYVDIFPLGYGAAICSAVPRAGLRVKL